MPNSSRCPHSYAPCPFCPETQEPLSHFHYGGSWSTWTLEGSAKRTLVRSVSHSWRQCERVICEGNTDEEVRLILIARIPVNMVSLFAEELCPKCGEESLDWDEVDIGVGVQRGPVRCGNPECGWNASERDGG